MQRHNIQPGKQQKRKGSSVWIRWLGGRSLHTTRSITQVIVGVVFNVSPHLYDFCCRPDCM